MSRDFYRAFEERHRGSRELIKSRLQTYVPFAQHVLSTYPGAQILDLGCGRGEWIELMGELGFQAYGVDLDDGMLDACRERGLSVSKGDGLALLRSLPDDSQAIVSAFHVVEHITFEQLQDFVAHALRVLCPGGLLIMETPNPENIGVGTRSFYLDPTHVRPIPDLLLSFMAEFHGFVRVKTLRLQEDSSLLFSGALSLFNVLTGVSPDYAVVAQKAGPEGLMQALELQFAKEYGLSLEKLAAVYDQQRMESFGEIDEHAQTAMALATVYDQHRTESFGEIDKHAHAAATLAARAGQQASAAQEQANEAREQARVAQEQANEAREQARVAQEQAKAALERAKEALEQASLSEASARTLATQLAAVYSSRSWRITAPLRWLSESGGWLRPRRIASFSKRRIRTLISRCLKEIEQFPRLRSFLIETAYKLRLDGVVRSVYNRLYIREETLPQATGLADQSLSPRENEMYQCIKKAVEEKARK